MTNAVNVDVERLKAFREKLKRFAEVTTTELKSMEGELNHLGMTWKDHKFAEFDAAFRVVRQSMGKQANVITVQYLPFLQRLIDDLTNFQNRRL